MKISFVLLTLTLVAVVLQTTYAKPHRQHSFDIEESNFGFPFNGYYFTAALNVARSSGSDAKQDGNILENIIDSINEALRNASNGILNDNKNISDASDNEIGNLVNENVAGHTGFINSFISGLNQEIKTVNNRIKQKRLQEVVKRLEDLNKSLSDLQVQYQAVNANWQNYIQNQESIVSDWNNWSTEQLDKVSTATSANEKKLAEAKIIVDEVVNVKSQNISDCVAGPEAEFKKYALQVNGILERKDLSLAGLVYEVVRCLQDSDTSSAGLRCSRQFQPHIKQIRKVPAEVKKFNKAGANVVLEHFENNICVGQILIEFALEKLAAERQLVEIISQQDESGSGNEGGNEGSEGGTAAEGADTAANDASSSNSDNSK